jgi:hypothetical protein
MERLLDTITFVPGQTILDIDANTCWATAAFARIGPSGTDTHSPRALGESGRLGRGADPRVLLQTICTKSA